MTNIFRKNASETNTLHSLVKKLDLTNDNIAAKKEKFGESKSQKSMDAFARKYEMPVQVLAAIIGGVIIPDGPDLRAKTANSLNLMRRDVANEQRGRAASAEDVIVEKLLATIALYSTGGAQAVADARSKNHILVESYELHQAMHRKASESGDAKKMFDQAILAADDALSYKKIVFRAKLEGSTELFGLSVEELTTRMRGEITQALEFLQELREIEGHIKHAEQYNYVENYVFKQYERTKE